MEYKRPMNELRPKLFDVMKGYTKEQLIKDILSGIIVAIIALPLSIALAIASGVGPVQGLYTAIVAGFFMAVLNLLTMLPYFLFRRKPCTDWRTNCRICCYHLWHRDHLRYRRTDCRNNHGRYHFMYYGSLPFWFPD